MTVAFEALVASWAVETPPDGSRTSTWVLYLTCSHPSRLAKPGRFARVSWFDDGTRVIGMGRSYDMTITHDPRDPGTASQVASAYWDSRAWKSGGIGRAVVTPPDPTAPDGTGFSRSSYRVSCPTCPIIWERHFESFWQILDAARAAKLRTLAVSALV